MEVILGTETVEDVVMRGRSKTCKLVLNGFSSIELASRNILFRSSLLQTPATRHSMTLDCHFHITRPSRCS